MRLLEIPRQHSTEWSLPVKKSNSADANCSPTFAAHSRHKIGSVEHFCPRSSRFAPREPSRKQPCLFRLLARRRGEETCEERLVRRVGKVSGCVSRFPSIRQQANQIRC